MKRKVITLVWEKLTTYFSEHCTLKRNLPNFECPLVAAHANDARNYAQQVCAMQFSGITLRQSITFPA